MRRCGKVVSPRLAIGDHIARASGFQARGWNRQRVNLKLAFIIQPGPGTVEQVVHGQPGHSRQVEVRVASTAPRTLAGPLRPGCERAEITHLSPEVRHRRRPLSSPRLGETQAQHRSAAEPQPKAHRDAETGRKAAQRNPHGGGPDPYGFASRAPRRLGICEKEQKTWE